MSSERTKKIKDLVGKLRNKEMTQREIQEQRISSVYGNGNASSADITLDTVRDTVDKINRK